MYSPSVISAVLGLRKLGACKAVSVGRLILVEGGIVERALCIAIIAPVSFFFDLLQILLQTYTKKMNGIILCNRGNDTAAASNGIILEKAGMNPTANIGHSIHNGRKVARSPTKSDTFFHSSLFSNFTLYSLQEEKKESPQRQLPCVLCTNSKRVYTPCQNVESVSWLCTCTACSEQ